MADTASSTDRSADPSGGHPFPQLRRSHWCSLDGPWSFAYDDDETGLERDWPSCGVNERTIAVPFPPESERSGVGDTGYHPVVWYSRTLATADLVRAGRPAQGERVLLHFGAVDYRASVWIDGQLVGEHEGGHVPFALDITRALPDGGEDALLVVRAEDRPLDAGQPRGKQDWQPEPHNIWYSRTTGIWQSVWLEAVPRTAIAELAWTPSRACDAVELAVTTTRPVPAGSRITARLTIEGHLLAEATARLPETTTAGLTIDLREQVHGQHYEKLLWSPEHPRLIGAEVMLAPAKAPLTGGRAATVAPGSVPDVVASYLGLRSVGTRHRRFLLNGRPYYVRAVLEQGFWPDSHLAAPDDGARRDEVALIKRLGFNAARLHQKIEDPRLLYWADRLGLLLWGEMPASYEFTTQSITRLVAEWGAAVRRDRSHPSIITWVPINESWGVQHLAHRPEQRALSRALADLTRAIDPSRPVVSNDGWEHTCSDIISIHDYDADDLAVTLRYAEEDRLEALLAGLGPAGRSITVQGPVDREAPVMVTEFGGIRYLPDGERTDGGEGAAGATNGRAAASSAGAGGARSAAGAEETGTSEDWEDEEDETTWGYTTADGPEDFEARLRRTFGALQASPHLAGFCYTQLTDTMQEANGLADAYRRPKISAKVIREIVRTPVTS
ncbi:glycoside hydrolase family 2 protein [Actinomyces israelii]|uniref:glycoside hydrolase family 2 protein n=1 Tax=Actinomyces israelii TaxID=1659 RepID=UPI0005BE25E6|nr:sugar-binding domain-containing protein [Actinomyces israelii]